MPYISTNQNHQVLKTIKKQRDTSFLEVDKLIDKINKLKFPIDVKKSQFNLLNNSSISLELKTPQKDIMPEKNRNSMELLQKKKVKLQKNKLTNKKKSTPKISNPIKTVQRSNIPVRKIISKTPAMEIADSINLSAKFPNPVQLNNRRTKFQNQIKFDKLNLAQKNIKEALQSVSKTSKSLIKTKTVEKRVNTSLNRNPSRLSLNLKQRSKSPVITFVNKLKSVAPVKAISKTPRKVFNQNKEIFPNPLNKSKEQQIKCPLLKEAQLASKEKRLAHRCRLAIKEGHSNNLHENKELLSLVLKALDDKIPWTEIQKILRDIGSPAIIGKNCFLLEIKYNSKISVLITVRTKNLQDLKYKLKHLLRLHGAHYETVINDFKSSALIEALASYRTQIKFADFEKKLAKDAIDCKANFIEIIDYETGAVNFKCDASALPDVTQALEQRDYKILYSDYGFQPKEKKYITAEEFENYMKFIRTLRSYEDIDKIYDNCRNKCNLTNN